MSDLFEEIRARALNDGKGDRAGRIDVHAHLLPAVDDGCQTVEESILCARILVKAGYSHAFCTPHIWPSFPDNTVAEIPRRVKVLQRQFDEAGVALKLFPGGELNLRPESVVIEREDVVTYGMAGRYCIFDIWADELPLFFEPAVERLQSFGLTVVMAHPERMRFVQRDPPGAGDRLQRMGLLLQGNLQCLSDPPEAMTRVVVEQYLKEGRYFMLGTDTHNARTLPCRLDGLLRAIELVGANEVDRLTIANPRSLIPG